MLHSTVRGILLSQHESFVGKEKKKRHRGSFLRACLESMEGNMISFEDIKQSDQAIKSNFMNIFSEWVKVHIVDFFFWINKYC